MQLMRPTTPLHLGPLFFVLMLTVASTCRADPPKLARDDALWLARITYGIDSASVAHYQQLGRRGYLDEQLSGKNDALPPAIAQEIAQMPVRQSKSLDILETVAAENKRIKAMPEGPDQVAARKSQRELGNQYAYQARRTEVLRALYSPAQLKEQMTWFWLNHFSVYEQKGNLRWLVGNYAEQAIRPNSLGHFRDLVMATLTHPAMIEYLDNAQNANGHINENYARELMELHTLGVDAGYTQQDVQELARVLTGVGITRRDNPPKLKPEWQPLLIRNDGFEFNPARHDFGNKTLLGKTIDGRGFTEVEQAVDLIVKQPVCARFVSRKIATYFVSDDPPVKLVEQMAKTFQKTDGDIAAVLRTMFESRDLGDAAGKKFKDPMQFVVSSLRLAYDGKQIANTHPVMNWLNALGEPMFGRLTPDGYALIESGWASSGQMSRRFEIAKTIGNGNAGLFDPEDGTPPTAAGFPQLASRLYYTAIEPTLPQSTRDTLDHATSQQEWNTYLLASPGFNYR